MSDEQLTQARVKEDSCVGLSAANVKLTSILIRISDPYRRLHLVGSLCLLFMCDEQLHGGWVQFLYFDYYDRKEVCLFSC